MFQFEIRVQYETLYYQEAKAWAVLLPTHAQAVIIGPVIISYSIVGCSTAYHFVEPMWKDVLALEPTPIFSDDLRAKTVQL
jgi:hypothetical protein